MLEINISSELERDLNKLAEQSGQDVADYVGNVLEKFVAQQTNGKAVSDSSQKVETEATENTKNPFAPFIGMFSSGKIDTSIRYKEILMEEIDKRGGFGGS
jgi:predicted DNA-binding protein